MKRKSEFTRNVLTLMTGTAIAQAIPIAISPILTRIYSPEEFGIFALYLSVASIPAIIATGRYELAIMLPKKDEDAIYITLASIGISFFVSLIVLFIVSAFNTEIAVLLDNTEISKWLYFIPITVFFTGVYKSINFWFNRKKEYKNIATSKVYQSSIAGGSSLSLGFSGFQHIGLIFGNLIGQIFATSYFVNIFYRKYKAKIRFNRLKSYALLRKYKKFPILNMLNALIDSLRLAGINILIAKYYSLSTLGQFSLAWRMVQMPISILSSSMSQVFYQKINGLSNQELYRYTVKFVIQLSITALLPFLLIFIFAQDLFEIFFGEKWTQAGSIASILTPWLYVNFISSPLSIVAMKIGKHEISLITSVVYMATPLSILYYFQNSDINYVLNLIVYAMVIILMVYIAIILFKLRERI